MAKSSRSTETLVHAIRESLADAASEGGQFCVAGWGEADGDACYLIHVDGRMVGVGDYQYGFSHVDDLLSPNLSAEVGKYARQEAGKIAGSMEPINLLGNGDDWGVVERLPSAFLADGDMVEWAAAAGALSATDMFELLSTRQGKLVIPGLSGRPDEIELTKDIEVSRLVQSEDGEYAWNTQVAFRAGEKAPGFVGPQGYANISVSDGYLHLVEGEYVVPEPKPRRGCAP